MEEVKSREFHAEQRIFPDIKVDSQCELREVKVFQDYSAKLTLQEVNFSAINQDKFVRMQLLERNDGKKWFLWIAQGRIGRDAVTTQIFEHFNKVDAIGDFEKRFFKRTENKWPERDNFKDVPGRFTFVVAERELEKLHNALAAEKEVT